MNQKLHKALRDIALHHPFFTSLAMSLEVKRDDKIPTACTDGYKILYNEEFINSLTQDQTLGLLIHEVLHCALGHLWRFAGHDHRLANVACDFSINNWIDMYNSEANLPVELPPGGCVDVPKYGQMAEEKVYQLLEDEWIKNGWLSEENECTCNQNENEGKNDGGGNGGPRQSGDENDSQDGGCGSAGGDDDGNSGQDCPKCGCKKSGSGGKPGKNGKPEGGPGDFKPAPAGAASSKRAELREKWEELLSSAIQQGKLRGMGGGNFLEKLAGRLNSEVDWESLLQRFLTEVSYNDFDEQYPDRRFLAEHDLCIPSLRTDAPGFLVFAKDTSGSMCGPVLERVVGKIQAAMSQMRIPKLAVIDADDGVAKVEEYTQYDTIPTTAHGRGGTDFRPTFKYVDEHYPNCRCLIYLTDGYGAFPDTPPGYPVIWIDYEGEVKYPFGQVVDVSKHNPNR